MDDKRHIYAEFIAKAFRFIQEVTGQYPPDGTIIVCKSYSQLAEYDSILGKPIYIMDMPSAYEWFLATPYNNTKEVDIQRALIEFFDLREME